MVKVSVVIPVYNVEKYLPACLDSVLSQSLREIEVICIDDKSPDRCGQILDDYAARDQRVQVIHLSENRRQGYGRNRGLDQAVGKYIYFLDSDDMITPTALEELYELSERDKLRAVFFDSQVIYDSEALAKRYASYPAMRQGSYPDAVLSGPALFDLFMKQDEWTCYVQRQFWDLDFIRRNGIRFPDYRWGEDRLFVFDCLERCGRVCILPECKYRYVMHEGDSLITRYYDKKFAVCLETDGRMQELCRRFGVKDDADMRYMFLKSVFSCLTTLFSPSCPLSYGEKRAEVRRILSNGQLQKRSRRASGGLPTRVLAGVLRSGSVTLTMLCFRLVAWVGKAAPGLFMTIKHRK